MNVVKKEIIYFLIRIYNGKFRFLKIRRLIKKLIGKERIVFKYQDIKLFVGVNTALENSILFDDYNEKEILNLITYFSKSNYDFIDVGANVGVHSLTASKANENIQVFSFEPEPTNYFNFLSNIFLNKVKNIKPFCLGVGNVQENKILNINSGWNKGRHSLKMNFGENNQKISISIISLDNFKIYLPVKQVVIKIDVEGFESEVLKGAKDTLSIINECVIIIELVEENNNLQICKEIIQILKDFGFNYIYKIGEKEQFVSVSDFYDSSDYVLLKGQKTLDSFKKYLN